MYKGYKIRCRGIIRHQGRLLVVKHKEKSASYVLPGGKMDPGEDPIACIKREILEELGVEIKGLRLLYVYTWKKNGKQNLDFMFLIENGEDFVDLSDKNPTHGFELFDIRWISTTDEILLSPSEIHEDFKNNKMNFKDIKFI